MKVLHLVGQREDNGGILPVIRSLQEAMRDTGWSHAVWVHADYRETRSPPLHYRYSRHICSDSPSHLRILLSAFRGFFEVRNCLRQERFEAVHAHTRGGMIVGLMAAAWLHRPVLSTNHAYAQRRWLYRWAAARPRFHTVVLTPNMARHYGLEANPRVSVISACCADHFFAEPMVNRAASDRAERPLRLVGLGNLVRWKNWHLLPQAMVRLPESQRRRLGFCHWGLTPRDEDAPRYEAEVHRLLRESGLADTVQFHGATNSVVECLRQADWFVLPSTNEPCSVALIEALALGLPVLASASGGNVDIVQPGRTGLLFEPDSVEDLAAKLRQIIEGSIQPLPPEAIRQTVRMRSASKVAAEYEKIYRQVFGFGPVPVADNCAAP